MHQGHQLSVHNVYVLVEAHATVQNVEVLYVYIYRERDIHIHNMYNTFLRNTYINKTVCTMFQP